MSKNVAMYRATNPEMNVSINEAMAVKEALQRAGFHVAQIICQPQFDGKGWGISENVSLDQLKEAGVGLDEPVNLMFLFAGTVIAEGQEVARVRDNLGAGDVTGVERVYAALNPGDRFGHLLQILRIPAVWDAVNAVLQGTDAPQPKKTKAGK